MPKSLFQCTICKTVHNSLSDAENCEQKGIPELAFEVGKIFQQQSLVYDDHSVTILAQKVVLSWGRHINKYQVRWARNTKWLTEGRIKWYVNRKSWV